MKRSTKIAIAVGALGAAAASLALALGRRAATPPTPSSTDSPTLPPRPAGEPTKIEPTASVPAPSGSELEPGWHTVGWYTYQGKAPQRLWIRVDAGPPTEELLREERPWRWTVIVGDAHPLATGTRTNMQSSIDPTLLDFSHTDLIAQAMARLGADWIDTYYGGSST